MTPARFRWGLFLILVGTLLLLRNFRVLNDNLWVDLLVLFPVVLIAVGIEKIFARTKFKAISYLTSVGLFVGGLAIAFAGSSGGTQDSFFSRTTYVQANDATVETLRAELNLDDADLTIRDSGDDLVYARFDRFTRKPQIDFKSVNGEGLIEMKSRTGGLLGGAVRIETDEGQDWFLRFSDEVPVAMTCKGYESDMHLNMSTTRLQELELEADDSKVYLMVGDLEPAVRVSILGRDTDLRLRVPTSVGLKVFGKEYKAYLNTIGLTESGEDEAFVNEGFDTLGNKVEVKLDDRLGSFSIEFF